MAIEASASKARYIGNGTAADFPFAFKAWDVTQLAVTVADADGEETLLTLDTDYSVTLTDTGGTVTLRGPLASGNTIAIVRNMPFLQEDRYITGTRFDPHEIEEALDIACAERQQLREKLDRAVTVSVSSNRTPSEYSEDFFAVADQVKEYRNFVEAKVDGFDAAVAAKTEEAVTVINANGDTQAQRLENIASFILSTHGKSYQEYTWKLASPILADQVITLPANLTYIVGRNQVRIHYDGIFLSKNFWEEVGTVDTPSTQIKFKTPFAELQELNVWIGSLDNTEENAERAEAAVRNAQEKIDGAADGIRSAVKEDADRAVNASEYATQVQARAEQTLVDINTAKSESLEAIAQAEDSATDTINTAKNIAVTEVQAAVDVQVQRASEEADRAEEAATGLESVEAKVDAAMSASSEALSTANSVYVIASDASSVAYGVDAKATQAMQDASAAQNKANEAFATASSAATKADEVASSVNSVESTAQDALTKANAALKTYVVYIENLGTTPPADMPAGGLIIYKTRIGG